MATKKYLSLERLGEYDALIKAEIASGDSSTLASAKSYADGLASGKSDSGHTHDDRYYTEGEIDSKISGINTSITNITSGTTVVKNAEHATTADSATTAGSATKADSATTAGSATKATQDGNGKVISSTYETKTDASAKLEEAKGYTNTKVSGLASTSSVNTAISNHNTSADAHSDIREILAEVKEDVDTFFKDATISTAAKDTLKEIQDYITSDVEAAAAMTASINNKADKEHDHAIVDVTGLQDALNGKADSSHGTHVSFDSTNKPKMDGTAAFGTSTKVARADHVHPTDTSRAAKSDLDSHTGNTTVHITADERTKWNAAKTHADSAHAPSNAQVNIIESIKVNGTAQTITSKAVNITVPTKASDIGAAESSHGHAISEITNLQTTLNNASSAIGANTSSINGHTTRIEALESKVGDGFEEITSAEIQALFA